MGKNYFKILASHMKFGTIPIRDKKELEFVTKFRTGSKTDLPDDVRNARKHYVPDIFDTEWFKEYMETKAPITKWKEEVPDFIPTPENLEDYMDGISNMIYRSIYVKIDRINGYRVEFEPEVYEGREYYAIDSEMSGLLMLGGSHGKRICLRELPCWDIMRFAKKIYAGIVRQEESYSNWNAAHADSDKKSGEKNGLEN